MLCNDCLKKSTCTELCQDAERYVNQDYAPQTELITEGELPDLDHGSCFDGRDLSDLSSPELKQVIMVLHNDGMSTREIAYHLPCSHVYIHKIIRGC